VTGDRGAASLLVVAFASVLLLTTAGLGVAGAMVAAHRTAQAAADLAALGGAAAHQRGDDGCAEAGRLAAGNGARLRHCQVAEADLVVEVVVAGPRWLGQPHDLAATARAGPGQEGVAGPS
jgi:secretion/DNA translocation related TadE-like protein